MRRIAQVWLALVCCGCAVGPNFVRPDPPSADRYGSEAVPEQVALGREIAAGWWTLFHFFVSSS